jgi:quercetin dioxygenase-like cupin family protein
MTTAKNSSEPNQQSAIPADDLSRALTLARPDYEDAKLPHIGMAGDTYTITVTGEETGGRYCVIDMHVPPGGGPVPHRHDFEETFILLIGELRFVCRGQSQQVRAGETIHIPANAPHQFHNDSTQPARMICICSPAGQENFFLELGVPVPTRTTPPPEMSPEQMAQLQKKARELAPKYRTEFLESA